MKSYEQIAKAMYEAWEKSIRRETGIELLSWSALPTLEQQAWIAAARQAVAEMATVH